MELYYPAAIQQPGPPEFVYDGTNAIEGAVLHSSEGRWSDAYTPVATMRWRRVSWHFTVMQDGRVLSHYPLEACCWHAGNEQANRRFVGIEHEGVAGEPLTAAQEAASVALTRWVAQQGGWAMERALVGRTLWEHRELLPSTSCPSGRIDWTHYTDLSPEPNKVALIYAIFRGEVMRLPVLDGRNRYEIRLAKEA